MQSTLTIVLAILIALSAIASCLHKRKPSQKYVSRDADDDLQPLGIPSGENVSELNDYPTKGGYVPAATSDAGYPSNYSHRANTMYRDPFIDSISTPKYEGYSSSYGSRRSRKLSSSNLSVAMRKASVGHDTTGNVQDESAAVQYRRIGSPSPVNDTNSS
jgi:hypothetical protein